jgi:hypothetical protein
MRASSRPRVSGSRDLLLFHVLAYDLVSIVVDDDVLDLGNHVTRQDCEQYRVGADLFVLARREREYHRAIGLPAFANELDRVEPRASADLLDALIDLAEERLVARKAFPAPFTSLV